MRLASTLRTTTILAASLVLVAGCKKTTDNSANYKSAINAWYSAHPACLWPQSQMFPTQVAASDQDKTAPFAALVDQGLLTRSTSEKKVIIISKQEVNYDLSDKGRSDWTADPNQPGYGNFCYGHRSVDSITNSTPNNGQPGDTATVNFSWKFSGAPDWAKSAEVQNAFPSVKTNLDGSGNSSVTLTDTSNGWQVQTPPPSPMSNNSGPATPADGKIVQ
ncbi:MAG: hypothetical protein WBY53_18995 [Acidobacteriaceae bacterium]